MSNTLRRTATNKTYEGILLGVLIPVVIFSWYKVGSLDYSKNLVSLISSFKVGWLLLINIIITCFIQFIVKDKYPYYYYEIVLLTLLLPIRIPYFIDILVVLIYNILRKHLNNYHFNSVAIFKLIITLILMVMGKNNYLSLYQEQVASIYKTSDLVWGASIGSIGSTNLVVLILSYLLLCNVDIYKKDIPWYALIGYSLALGIYGVINNSIIDLIKLTLNSTVIFSFIFISTINISSPIGKKLKRIYGLLVGIISFIFLQINPYDAAVIAVVISNLICNFIYEIILN